MITPNDFMMDVDVLKWTWLRHGQTGSLHIEFLNWQNPADEPIKTLNITDKDYRSYYMRYGFVPPVTPGLPLMIRVHEQVMNDAPCSFVHTILSYERVPICWQINKSDPSMWKISVQYPRFSDVSPETYPDNAFYFLVRAAGESAEQGAKFFLPRPADSTVQTFWFSPTEGYTMDLRMDGTLPVGKSDTLTVGEVFTLKRA